MNFDLLVWRAKPNPIGKDRRVASQLHAEWVDVKNVSARSLQMADVKIYDHTFNNVCGDHGPRLVFTFPAFVLPVGAVVRIHSGKAVLVSQLPLAEQQGADYHAFTNEQEFIWNNVCGDFVEIRSSQNIVLDKTSYGPRPLEGKTLLRQGAYLA